MIQPPTPNRQRQPLVADHDRLIDHVRCSFTRRVPLRRAKIGIPHALVDHTLLLAGRRAPARLVLAALVVLSDRHPQHKVDHHGCGQGARQNGRSQAVVKAAKARAAAAGTATRADAVGAPVEDGQGIDHARHRDQCEQARRDLADLVAKVEKPDGESTEDDGEIEPGEEGTFVGEEDFGLDAKGKGDALACGDGCVSTAAMLDPGCFDQA